MHIELELVFARKRPRIMHARTRALIAIPKAIHDAIFSIKVNSATYYNESNKI